jgi:hypothetical protein
MVPVHLRARETISLIKRVDFGHLTPSLFVRGTHNGFNSRSRASKKRSSPTTRHKTASIESASRHRGPYGQP